MQKRKILLLILFIFIVKSKTLIYKAFLELVKFTNMFSSVSMDGFNQT